MADQTLIDISDASTIVTTLADSDYVLAIKNGQLVKITVANLKIVIP